MLMSTHEARLAALRHELEKRQLDGFIIPIADEHMSEYVGIYAQRLAWLTGFDGSAGSAVVLRDAHPSSILPDSTSLPAPSALFVDGRYTLQAQDQVNARLFTLENIPETSPAAWIEAHAGEGARIGYDPWLHSAQWVETTTKRLGRAGIVLLSCESNPIDAIWADRPQPSLAPAEPHALCLAGESGESKHARITAWLDEHLLAAVVISSLDSLAWLLNIRGRDVLHTPVARAFALAHADGSLDLFIAPEKLTPALMRHLGNTVRTHPYEALTDSLRQLAGVRVSVDKERCAQAIITALADACIVDIPDPCLVPKACKNIIEQAGHRAAQARDGAAMARFLHWLSHEAPSGDVTEISAAERLEAFRAEGGALIDLSFDTISGAGPNGAICHYRVNPESNSHLQPSSVYLVDSGGQYRDGTTDITRTVWIGPGEPPCEVKDRFTRVLKGHIALATATFPRGTCGGQLDSLARRYLWDAGLDYAHGTGHGVGSFLAVHEGPQRIGKMAGGQAGTGHELLAGMIVSNEPGYYKAQSYGIRIENLLLVEERLIPGAEGSFLGFETLTLVPIDRTLVELSLLKNTERQWWNHYHARVHEVLAPQLGPDDQRWLDSACHPL